MSNQITWQDREKVEDFSWQFWEPRIKEMASMIDENVTSVLDLGAGGMLLKKYLPESVSYYPVDYTSRCEQTIVCDFNSHQFPKIKVDVVFISGCLEYVEDVDWFLDEVAKNCNIEIIMSYAPIEFTPDFSARRENAWVSDISTVTLTHMIQERGFVTIQQEYHANENPYQVLYKFKKADPSVLSQYKLCTGCGACSSVCPTEALTMQQDKDGFLHPVFNSHKCVGCGRCLKTCPSLHPNYKNTKEPDCFAVWADDVIREQSSSGGIFTLLADEILRHGGHVCGAAWVEDFQVQHIIIHNVNELSQLRHSKYVQSDLKNSYQDIKGLLDRDETVLFSGCPCQVAGLYAFLGREYENLYTIDLLCHCVPSPAIFTKYLQDNFAVSNLANFEFRSKRNGWNGYTQLITMKDSSEIIRDISNDFFQKGFHPRLFTNTACEYCQFANFPRQGDITIGDFWGYEKFDAKLSDKNGTSTVLLNNDKGMQLFEQIQQVCKLCKPVPLEYAKANRITQYCAAHPGRDRFFDLIQRMPFNKAVDYALNGKYDVGIVGDWSVENYGANLTYYALYSFIRDKGYEPIMIERPADSPWAPNSNPICFQTNPYRSYDLAQIYPTKQDMKQLTNQCDTFLVGSDQLFNDCLYDTFGQFVSLDWVKNNRKKIAYGASFASDCFYGTEDTRAKMSYFMKQFDYFSVREKSGVGLANDEFGVTAEWVLDPVFLCDKKHYDELAHKGAKLKKEKYIGIYMVDPTRDKASAIHFAMEKLSLPCNAISDAYYSNEQIDNVWNIETCHHASCESWLRNIADCDFLITDSFHGVCFAILYEKPFIAIANERRGLARFTSILELLGLMDRMVFDPADIHRRPELFAAIDYASVNKKLNQERARSAKWLKDALNINKNASYTTYDILNDRLDNMNTRLNVIDEYATGVNKRFEQIDGFAKNANNRFEEIDGFAQNVNNRFEEIDGFIANVNIRIADLDNQLASIEQSMINFKEYMDYINSRSIRYKIQKHFPKPLYKLFKRL